MSDPKILTKRELNEKLKAQIDPTDPSQSPKRGGRMRGSPAVGPKPKNIRQTVFRLLSYMGVFKFALLFVALALIASTLMFLLVPILFSFALDNHFLQFDFEGVYRIALIILFLALFNSMVRFFSRFVMARISQKVVKKLRSDAFDKLMKAPVSYYDEKGSGDIVSRISNDVELISNSLGQTVLEVINSSIVIVGAFFFMFYLNWMLALVVVAFLPIMVLFTVKISKKTRKGFKEQQIHLASLNGIIEENVSGLKTVKLYNQEEPFIEEFRDENDKLKRAGFMAQFFSGLIWPFIHFMNNLIFLTVIGVGAFLHLYLGAAFVTIGHIAGVSQYSRQFIMPISNLAQLFNALMQGIAGAERVFEIIDAESEYDADGEVSIDTLQGEIEFDDVTFGYDEDVLVLQDITFRAKKGELIAIVGPTGGGKTTTIKLLNRFYDVLSGSIKLDGIDVREMKKDELRKKIGVVLQDTHLFKGSVFDNIHYGDFDATKEEVLRASKLAGAHDFIVKLPKGYDTEIHEGGQNFSQGERQLISIARTILSDPDLLILDEATSNVDTRTEAKIQESMNLLMEGRTSIVIAHRLQTIQKADKILVIHKGRLIETGTHASLLEQKGFYHSLYQAQFE